MKKSTLLTLALGLSLVTPALADTDIYITGSTAFRSNVHDACLNLFGGTPTKFYDTTKVIGGDGTSANSNPVWTFTGTPTNTLTALTGSTLTIHADFTGSVQGMQAVQNSVKVWFLSNTGGVISNTPTIAFSDNSSTSTPFPVDGSSYNEETVGVQPFVFIKSNNNGGAMTNISNVTWEQIKYIIQAGRIPLAAWTQKPADTNVFVYLINRTKDSGTRRTTYAYVLDGYNQSQITYNYDVTNNVFYRASNTLQAAAGGVSNGVSYGVIGSAGVGNVNLSWGQGYVGGGDVRTAVGIVNPNNLSIGYLSFADARTVVNVAGSNWTQVVSLNGTWPTAAGAGLYGHTGTNDFTPVTVGSYGNWGYEVVVYPIVEPHTLNVDQNVTLAQLGSQTVAGTFLGVLDNIKSGAPLPGSLDFEIEKSKTTANGATAIRYFDMISSRSSVGGTIAP